jgi:hypothetical protein
VALRIGREGDNRRWRDRGAHARVDAARPRHRLRGVRAGRPEIRELGVGINTLPHAIKELAELGLLDRLDAVAIRTYELIYTNRFGQEIWREPRGSTPASTCRSSPSIAGACRA